MPEMKVSARRLTRWMERDSMGIRRSHKCPEEKKCLYCGLTRHVWVVVEIVQYGMWSEYHLVIMHCDSCSYTSYYSYEIEDENKPTETPVPVTRG